MEWMDLMRRGEFAAAWRLSDSLLGVPQNHGTTPRHVQRIWSGEPIAGRRVLVRCYHGLGDTIQFIRFMPMLKQVAREVIVWAQPALLPILQSVRGIDRLLPLHDGEVEAEYDVDVEVMELPHVFRTTIDTVPADVPYIAIEKVRLPPPRSALRWTRKPDTTHVGFMWRSGEWDPARSIPFSAVATLLDVPSICAVPLELALADEEASRFHGRPDVGSIPALARTIASLDLVVTVDTMAAHLAGALGVRTWLLLHGDPDWRWMRDRSDSPWYPLTTIYRQTEAGSWGPMLRRVRCDLEASAV